jgi:TonB family protein
LASAQLAGAAAPPGAAADTQGVHSRLQRWNDSLQRLHQTVWQFYAASGAMGPDRRGRTLANDLDEWLMPGGLLGRLQAAGDAAARDERTGRASAASAVLDAVQPAMDEQLRRMRLIAVYWTAQLWEIEPIRDQWLGWLKQASADLAARSRGRVEPLETDLARHFTASEPLPDLRSRLDALRDAYLDENVALGGSVSDARAAAGGVMAAHERSIPCAGPTPVLPGDTAGKAIDSANRGLRVAVAAPVSKFYPLAARREGISGRVMLRIIVGTDGCVWHTELLRSSGSRLLDEAAMRAAEYFRFYPALRNGQPVVGRVRLPIAFQLGPPPAPLAGSGAAE